MSKSSPTLPHNLYERLHELPAAVYHSLREHLREETQVSRVTIHNVLQGKSQNTQVLLSIAKFLNCEFKQVLDPSFQFQDPRLLSEDQRRDIMQRLNLTIKH